MRYDRTMEKRRKGLDVDKATRRFNCRGMIKDGTGKAGVPVALSAIYGGVDYDLNWIPHWESDGVIQP